MPIFKNTISFRITLPPIEMKRTFVNIHLLLLDTLMLSLRNSEEGIKTKRRRFCDEYHQTSFISADGNHEQFKGLLTLIRANLTDGAEATLEVLSPTSSDLSLMRVTSRAGVSCLLSS